MNLVIETTGLTRVFGSVRAVDGLDLRIEAGKFFGFLGPNGAGKSTTIKMLTGLLAPSSGQMRVLGEDLADDNRAREVRRRIGVVPENLALFDNLTGREYLTFIGRMYLLPAATVRARCDELLAMMGLENEEKKLTLEYSHGMKKKLALAAALLPGPDLLFLDEPFEGVDAVSSRVLRDVLRRCVKHGATVFLRRCFSRRTCSRSSRNCVRTSVSSPTGSSFIRPRWTKCGRMVRWRNGSSRHSGRKKSKPSSSVGSRSDMRKPTPNPSKERSKSTGARTPFPSWEGSGVGS